MFNKAIRKFTTLCKTTFESEIALQIMHEEAEAKVVVESLKT
jgi:hypothetical protein